MKKLLLTVLLILSLSLFLFSCVAPDGEAPESDTHPPTEDSTACEHSYGKWSKLADPTCTALGKEQRTCNICNESEARDIPALGHTVVGVECSVCGPLPLVSKWDASATDEDNVEVKLWQISENNNILEVSGSGAMKDYSAHNELVNGSMQYICNVPWYSYKESINYVTVGREITYIGRYAFHRTNITSFTFPSCETIDKHGDLFLGSCANLAEIFFPANTVEYLEDLSGESLSEMTHEEFEKKITEASNYWLRNYLGTTLFIHEDFISGKRRISVDGWGSKTSRDSDGYVFFENGEEPLLINYEGASLDLTLPISFNGKKCNYIPLLFWEDSINSLTIPDGATEMPDVFFAAEFNSITIPKTLSKISVYGPNKLDKVYISDIESFLKIDYHTDNPSSSFFFDTYLYLNGLQLTELTVPETITEIKYMALSGIRGIKKVTLHDSITAIGGGSFSYTDITSVTLPEGIKSISNSLFANSAITQINIPSSVTYIGSFAFADTKITQITLPNSVTYVGDSAFKNTEITEIDIPDSTTEIGTYIFSNCEKLTKVRLGNGIKEVPHGIFENCPALTDIDLPDNCTSVSTDIFGLNGEYTPDFENYLIVDGWLIDCNVKDALISIPEGVVGVNINALSDISILTEIIFPEGVKYIRGNGHFPCLSVINIPSTIKTIDNKAFLTQGREDVTLNVASLESWINLTVPTETENRASNIILPARNIELYVMGEKVSNLTISSGEITQGQFNGISGISSLVIGKDVTAVNPLALCLNVNEVTLYNAEFAASLKYIDGLKTIYFYGTEDEWQSATADMEFKSTPEIIYLT